MKIAHRFLPHYTYGDYVWWEGRWEVIDGILFAQRPSPEHQRIAVNLTSEFLRAIKKSGCSCKAYPPIDYLFSDDNVFNPDLTVVC